MFNMRKYNRYDYPGKTEKSDGGAGKTFLALENIAPIPDSL